MKTHFMMKTKPIRNVAKKIGIRFQNKGEILKVLKSKLVGKPLLYQLIAADGPLDGLTHQALLKLFRTGKYEKGEEIRAFEIRDGFWSILSEESFEDFDDGNDVNPKILGSFFVTRCDPSLFIDHEPEGEKIGQTVGLVEITKNGTIFVWDTMLAYVGPDHKPFIDIFVWQK